MVGSWLDENYGFLCQRRVSKMMRRMGRTHMREEVGNLHTNNGRLLQPHHGHGLRWLRRELGPRTGVPKGWCCLQSMELPGRLLQAPPPPPPPAASSVHGIVNILST